MYSSNKSPHLEAPLLPFQRPRRHVSYHGPQARLLLLSEAAVHCLVSSLTFCPSLLLPDPSYSGEWRHLLEKLRRPGHIIAGIAIPGNGGLGL